MPETTANQAGHVVTVTGEVTAESGGEARILSVDSPIYQDDVLVTDQGERIEVLFSDGTRLSQGENSRLAVDTYVFDPQDPDAAALLLQAAEGTFRTITGEIADRNPDNFTIKTPLATLGIRGTTVLSHITPEHEIHGPEFIEEGKAFVLIDNFGNIRFITDHEPVKVIDVRPDEPAGFQRMLTAEEFLFFEQQVPITVHEEDATTGTDIVAPLGEDHDGSPLFGHDHDGEETQLSHLARTPHLFGPEGMPEQGAESSYHHLEPPSHSVPEDIHHTDETTTVNYPPVADDLFATGAEDQPLTGTLTATDPEGDDLVFSRLSDPLHGTLTINPDGTYLYQPFPNYFGADSFTYRVTDIAGNEDSGTVDLRITPVNDAPTATDGAFTATQGAPFNGVLQGSDLLDGDTLTYSLVTPPAFGQVVVNPDGSFTYTTSNAPGVAEYGPTAFQFRVDDGHGGEAIGTMNIMVRADYIGTGGTGGPGGNDTPPVGTPLDDTFQGMAGDDTLQGMGGNDTVDGGDGNDALFGGPGNDTLVGGLGTDTLNAGTGNDNLDGGPGQDILFGDAGNDVLKGGAALDIITGGGGSDQFVYANIGEGGDQINDFQTGIDQLRIGGTGLGPGRIITQAGAGAYPGSTTTTTLAPGPGIILYNNTTAGTWQVIYDPNISTFQTLTPNETLVADLGGNPIDSGDVVLF
ncbi:MAG: hypothetical protein Kow0089_06170 [Desulfobulbaceae bacterium]